jgi:hypothetical protein
MSGHASGALAAKPRTSKAAASCTMRASFGSIGTITVISSLPGKAADPTSKYAIA